LELRAKADLESAKELFFREVDNAVRPAWRSDTESPLDFLIRESRSADLLVVGRHGPGDGDRGEFDFSVGTLLMESGRPVFLVPSNTSRLLRPITQPPTFWPLPRPKMLNCRHGRLWT
jgi:hypothetical protein